MSYNRQLSPGSRRLTNPGRVSDTNAGDTTRYERQNSYTSPRSSAGVIPISTQTFVTLPQTYTRAPGDAPRYESYSSRPTDSYTGRPRRSSLIDTSRASTSTTALPSRTRPTVVQQDFGRPPSPQKQTRDRDYYVTPGVTKEPRSKVESKKVYSVADGSASLVAETSVAAGGERHHKRRESFGQERGGYRTTEKDRGRRGYHLNGPSMGKERTVDDDGAYSHIDAASMFTEYREGRPRRGSVDRGGASRERPVSMLDMNFDSRKMKEIGPPPSTRGWDKLNDGLGRARSVRENRGRDMPQSPNRARVPQSPTRAGVPQSPTRGRYPEQGAYSREKYYVLPRRNSSERRSLAVHQDRPVERYEAYEYDDRREPRRHERRSSVTRVPDRSVERRGFGIRGDSQDRYGPRGSDESFERAKYRSEAAFAVPPPHRRDTAPEIGPYDERRYEAEKAERVAAKQAQNGEAPDRLYERDDRDKDRRRDEGSAYKLAYERDRQREYDIDRERERERERMMEPQPERHHARRESNRDFPPRTKETGSRDSGEVVPLAGAAVAGAALGAAALGATREKDDRGERDRHYYDAPPPREYERERERRSPRLQAPPAPAAVPVDPAVAASPAPYPQDRERERDRNRDRDRDRYRESEPDRGLGFAFESISEPTRPVPPRQDGPVSAPAPAPSRETGSERDHDVDLKAPPAPPAVASAAIDPDEDYRRRMEQVQRELGRASEDRAADIDPDRERRRREREQRQRERDRHDYRNGDASASTLPPTAPGAYPYDPNAPPGAYPYESSSAAPPPPRGSDTESLDGTTVNRPGTLHRRPSILDRPMPMAESGAQIIDNSLSEKRENRVRIVEPPTETEVSRPRGILKKPTEKFPEPPNVVREGVAPLKDASKHGIPPGARWTKIDRRLVNPEALEEMNERYEERQDFVIVLRVVTKEEIQKLADRTREIRDDRYEADREARRSARRHDRNRDRRERDEYEDENSEDEFKTRAAPKLLELPAPPPPPPTSAPPTTAPSFAGNGAPGHTLPIPLASGGGSGASSVASGEGDYVRDRERRRDRDGHSGRDRERERDGHSRRDEEYMSGGLGRRD